MDLIPTIRALWPSGLALAGQVTRDVRDAVAEELTEAAENIAVGFLAGLPQDPDWGDAGLDKGPYRDWATELRLPPISATAAYPTAEGLHRVMPSIVPWRNIWGAMRPSMSDPDYGPPRIKRWLQDMLGTTSTINIYSVRAAAFPGVFGSSGVLAANCYLLANGAFCLDPVYQCLAGQPTAYAGATTCQCGYYTTYAIGAEVIPTAPFVDPTDATKFRGLVGVEITGTYPAANRQWLEEVLLTAFPAGLHVVYKVTWS